MSNSQGPRAVRRYADALRKRTPGLSRDHASEFALETRNDPPAVRETAEVLIREGAIKNLGVQGVIEAARLV